MVLSGRSQEERHWASGTGHWEEIGFGTMASMVAIMGAG
jgi:hypothetical protein